MNTFVKLLVVLSVQLVFYLRVDAYRQNCEISQEEADKCAIKLMFEGDRQRFVPRTLADMDIHCGVANNNIKCLEKHSKCYPAFPRQIMSAALLNLKKAFKKRCSKSGRREFLKHTACVKDNKQSEPAHQTIDKWTFNMKYILNSVDRDQQIPASCCAFHIFRDDLLKTVGKLCEKTTKNETALYIEKTVMSGVSDFLDLGCNKYHNLNDCRSNLKEVTKKLEENVKNGVPKQTSSAIFQFLRIAVRF